MINYIYDCYNILNKVYSDKTYLKQAINGTIIEEKNRALTIKTCYGVLDRDIELSYYIKKLTDKSPKLVIRTILKISMYAIKYLNKKEYAVTENAVALTKKLGKTGASGFVNAFLRRFIKEKIDFPEKKEENLSIKYSYPEFAVKKLIKTYGEGRTESIISATNPYQTLVFYGVDGEEYLTNLGVKHQKTPYENVFSVENFTRNIDFDKGVYTYQALGSVAICDGVEKGNKLLDCCSAPGGKSVRLSSKFDSVISWDVHEHRVALITAYKERMGVKNISEEQKDAKIFDKELVSQFDAVLVDAPCSGLGVVNDNPDIKLNREENSIKELILEQEKILNTVKNYVKKGGYLYYSTCSVLDEENYLQMEKFVKENPEFSPCEIESKLEGEVKKIGIQYLPDISKGLGFYFAKLKRIS
ncbi:MAG: methyltransferase domain-containing protein [Clostridia bacterium]|nr:methyltransferase domain-containing protein [Clostridia bacterium]